MSISSAIAAEYGNRVKEDWQKELKIAFNTRSWKRVWILYKKLEKYRFSE